MKKVQLNLAIGELLPASSVANAAIEEVVVTATKRAESIQDVPENKGSMNRVGIRL